MLELYDELVVPCEAIEDNTKTSTQLEERVAKLETNVSELKNELSTGTTKTHELLALLLAQKQAGGNKDTMKYLKYRIKNVQ